jgi:hypothetical protein
MHKLIGILQIHNDCSPYDHEWVYEIMISL